MKKPADITAVPLKDLKRAYKEYLEGQGLAVSSVSSAVSGAFYVWDKCGKDIFWSVINSDDFEQVGRALLRDTLTRHSGGNLEKNLNNAMVSLRRFRAYVNTHPMVEIARPDARQAERIARVMGAPIEDARSIFKIYLTGRGYSHRTITSSISAVFFIWNARGKDAFWEVMTSDNFEVLGRAVLLEILNERLHPNPDFAAANYMGHMRRFRDFLADLSLFEVSPSNNSAAKKTREQAKRKKLSMPRPTPELVRRAIELCNGSQEFVEKQNLLYTLFQQTHPENKDLSQVLIKCSVLNDMTGTAVVNIFPVAKNILRLDIDERLKAGDETLVADIEAVDGKKYYSFAAKYLNCHNPQGFPAFDIYIEKALRVCRVRDGFSDFTGAELRRYPRFKAVLADFRRFYGLEEFELNTIARFLLLLGRGLVPK